MYLLFFFKLVQFKQMDLVTSGLFTVEKSSMFVGHVELIVRILFRIF